MNTEQNPHDCQYRRALVRLRNAISELSEAAMDELNAIDEGASAEAYGVLNQDVRSAQCGEGER